MVTALSTARTLTRTLTRFRTGDCNTFPTRARVTAMGFSSGNDVFELMLRVVGHTVIQTVLSRDLTASRKRRRSETTTRARRSVTSLRVLRGEVLMSSIVAARLLGPFMHCG